MSFGLSNPPTPPPRGNRIATPPAPQKDAPAAIIAPRRTLVTALLLVIAAWVIYFPSIWYGYVYYDDVRILKDHPELYGQPSLSADLRAIFINCFPREEPLLIRDASWAIDSRIFGFGNPLGYHLGNVLLHRIAVAPLV